MFHARRLLNSIALLTLGFTLISSAQAADKTVGIIVFDDVLSSDITAPMEVFGIASKKSWFDHYQVIIINVGDGETITTEEGLTLTVDAHLKDTPEVDVLLVPSAYDMKPLLNNQALLQYVKDTAVNAEWMASNCSGAFVLAEAGLLNGRKATTWAGGEGKLQRNYPQVQVQVDRNYVIDDNIITSNGSVVSYHAALALLEQMASPRRANEVRDALQMQRVWKNVN